MAQTLREQAGDAALRRDRRVRIQWAALTNEQRGPMRWLGSWVVREDGTEGAWFYSGFGSESTTHDVPPEALAVRIRRWVSEGLDPEYVDVPCAEAEIATDALDFDTPQPHRVLVVSGH
jgi:hypothetical protein